MFYENALGKSPLLANITPEEAERLFTCLSAQKKAYPKGAYISIAGVHSTRPGIILSGKVQLIKEDYFGGGTLMATLTEGDTFGEALVHTKDQTLPANVYAATDCRILFFSPEKLTTMCQSRCICHSQFLKNVLGILSEKNKYLTQRIGHITKRSLREKICAYLSEEGVRQKSRTVEIPYNRQELADYLAADRTALSAELSRMQKEGLISYKKNKFVLHSERAFATE